MLGISLNVQLNLMQMTLDYLDHSNSKSCSNWWVQSCMHSKNYGNSRLEGVCGTLGIACHTADQAL